MSKSKITAELIRSAAPEILKEVMVDATTIAKAYSFDFDGYDLGRELEEKHSIPPLTMNQVRRLDSLIGKVNSELTRAEQNEGTFTLNLPRHPDK